MKLVIIIMAALSLAACGRVDCTDAGITGGASETCIDGVTYLRKPVGC